MFLNVREKFCIGGTQVIDYVHLFASSVFLGYTPLPKNLQGSVASSQEILSDPKKGFGLYALKNEL